MIVGFAGTRHGMSGLQAHQLQYVLALLLQADRHVGRETVFVDGNSPAGGADMEARAIARGLGCEIDPERPRNNTAKELLARDRRIASRCSLLIAAPETDTEQRRSGTWATVRYARAAGKPVVMLSRGGG